MATEGVATTLATYNAAMAAGPSVAGTGSAVGAVPRPNTPKRARGGGSDDEDGEQSTGEELISAEADNEELRQASQMAPSWAVFMHRGIHNAQGNMHGLNAKVKRVEKRVGTVE